LPVLAVEAVYQDAAGVHTTAVLVVYLQEQVKDVVERKLQLLPLAQVVQVV
jgi:hypothetical protein